MKRHRYTVSIAIVALLGAAAVSARWLGTLRPDPPELRTSRIIVVLSGADRGPGTLREAIFAAARSGERTRIVLRPREIVLRSPLPPVVVPDGVVLDGSENRCAINGAAVPAGPLLEIASPNSVVMGVRVVRARDQGLLVKASNVIVRSSQFSSCGDGVSVAPAATAAVVENSTFEGNVVGIRVHGEARGTIIRDNQFSRHEEAGLWIATSTPIADATPRVAAQRNRFRADRISIAVINTPALIEGNQIQGNREFGIFLFGSRAIVRQNQIAGAAHGIVVDASSGPVIESNEIGQSRSVGLLVRASRRSVIQRNRIYANAYGIAAVFGEPADPDFVHDNLVTASTYDGVYLVGASPLLRGNQILHSGTAGVRILDFIPWSGPTVVSQPRLEANVLRLNGSDAPVRGQYRPQREVPSP